MESTKPASEVFCLRVQQPRSAEEHLDCPYCNGREGDVASGERSRFCDFQAGNDPVHFGFPEGTERNND